MLYSCLKSRPSSLTVEAYDQGVPETTSFACHVWNELHDRTNAVHVGCCLASISGRYKEEKRPGFEAIKEYCLHVHNKYISPFFMCHVINSGLPSPVLYYASSFKLVVGGDPSSIIIILVHGYLHMSKYSVPVFRGYGFFV